MLADGGDQIVPDLKSQHAGIVRVLPVERDARGSEGARVPLSELLGLLLGSKERPCVPTRQTAEHADPRLGHAFGQCSNSQTNMDPRVGFRNANLLRNS